VISDPKNGDWMAAKRRKNRKKKIWIPRAITRWVMSPGAAIG
jgi:hypothetical protein